MDINEIIQKQEYKYIVESFNYYYILNEERGIVNNFDEVIDHIYKNILILLDSSAFAEKCRKTIGDFIDIYSNYSYNPKTKVCFKVEEPEPLESIHPIYIRFDLSTKDPFYLAVEGKDTYPHSIYIVINFYRMTELLYDFDSSDERTIQKRISEIGHYKTPEHFIYSKLKHEFLHARSLYNEYGKDITNIKRFVTQVNLDDFTFTHQFRIHMYRNLSNVFINTPDAEKFFNDYISQTLYLFSPQEMEARINETAAFVDKLSDNDIKSIIQNKETFMEQIFHLMIVSNSANQIDYMKKLLIINKKHKWLTQNLFNAFMLFGAFFLKYHNRYKTQDKLSIEYLKSFEYKRSLDEIDRSYVKNYIDYINEEINKYTYKIQKTIAFILEKRIKEIEEKETDKEEK